jgi:hypothetical protein
MPYSADDWYWIVEGDESHVFYSKTGKRVPVTNGKYKEWLEREGAPSRIGSWEELYDVLEQHAPEALPAAADTMAGTGSLSPKQIRKIKMSGSLDIKFKNIAKLKGKYPIDSGSVQRYKIILQKMIDDNVQEIGIEDAEGNIQKLNQEQFTKLIDTITNYTNSVNFTEAVALTGAEVQWPSAEVEIE